MDENRPLSQSGWRWPLVRHPVYHVYSSHIAPTRPVELKKGGLRSNADTFRLQDALEDWRRHKSDRALVECGDGMDRWLGTETGSKESFFCFPLDWVWIYTYNYIYIYMQGLDSGVFQT